jgi:transcriptional regulator with XRE-family HTH domain
MPRWRKPTNEETRERRRALSECARAGNLRLPHAIVDMRHALGLSQTSFAKLFKMTTRQIAEIERGEANPTADTMNKIGRAFGFQIGFVLQEDHSLAKRQSTD